MEKSLFYMLHPTHSPADFSFSFCGLSQTLPSHSFGPAMRDAYIVHIILNGQGELWSSGIRYRLHQDEGFLIRPDDASSYCASDTKPWTYLWMGFTGNQVAGILRDIGIGAGHEAFRVRRAFPFLNLVVQCFSYTGGTLPEELKLQALAYEFLVLLSEQIQQDSVPGVTTTNSELVREAVAYMSAHYSEGIGVADVADALHVSQSHLSREFSSEAGLTAKEFLDKIRMTKACDLLSLTDDSIAQIVRRCGYSGTDTFFRKFRESQHSTPTQFRQLHQTLNNGLDIDIDFFKAIFQR